MNHFLHPYKKIIFIKCALIKITLNDLNISVIEISVLEYNHCDYLTIVITIYHNHINTG